MLQIGSYLMALSFCAGLSTGGSYAQADEYQDYQTALKIADQHVQRKKANSSVPLAGALSSTRVKSVRGKYYEVGETWEVAAYQFESTQMRVVPSADQGREKNGLVGIFRYRVKEVKTGQNPRVVFEVTQLEKLGHKTIDPIVETLVLTMDEQSAQSAKSYVMKNLGAPVGVSAQGIRAKISPLELFPLDIPDVETAEAKKISQLPPLPEGLKAIASESSFSPNISNSVWFEQDDLFGRSIEMLWQKGDPWPSYMKTAHGVAILIRKGGA